MDQYVTFNLNAEAGTNSPALTTNEALAYTYGSFDAADTARDKLKSSGFGQQFQIEQYRPHTFRLKVGPERQFEIHPCVLLDSAGDELDDYTDERGVSFQRTEENDPHIVCWSLYERNEDGTVEWLRDFQGEDAKAQAELALAEGIEVVNENPDRWLGSLPGDSAMKSRGITRDEGNDEEERDPNDCAECARSFGPHYTGKCDHG